MVIEATSWAGRRNVLEVRGVARPPTRRMQAQSGARGVTKAFACRPSNNFMSFTVSSLIQRCCPMSMRSTRTGQFHRCREMPTDAFVDEAAGVDMLGTWTALPIISLQLRVATLLRRPCRLRRMFLFQGRYQDLGLYHTFSGLCYLSPQRCDTSLYTYSAHFFFHIQNGDND
jgi:hypothetical protein